MIRRFALVLLFCLLATPAWAQQTLKIATLAPDGSAWMRELRAAAAQVQQGTQGRVRVQFYPGGVMGSDATVLRKMRLGQLQGGVLTGSELSVIYPDATIYSLPFLFSDQAQVDRVRAQVDPLLMRGFEAHGLKVLGISGVGFAYMMGARPMRTRADMGAIKLWIPQNDRIASETFRAGGISPIPLPLGDVFTSLQTGMVDTVANTPAGAVALQWHGRIRHVVDMPLTYVVGYLVLDQRAWARLSPADQAVVARAFGAASDRIDAASRRDDASALAAMRRQGVTVAPLDPAEAARWRQVGAQVTRQLEAEGGYSPETLAAIRRAMGGGR
jgi:TRAP-type C4-dicarboxylate transport system substrate-binding protein